MKLKIRTRRRLYAAAAGFAAGLLTLGFALAELPLLEDADAALYDRMAVLALAPERASKKVRVLDIDEATLAYVQQEYAVGWPWPREFFGVLVEFLRRHGAAAVGFDFIFGRNAHGYSDDLLFAESLRRAGNTMLAFSLRGMEAARPPEARVGVRLFETDDEAAAWSAVERMLSLGLDTWIYEDEKGRWRVYAGGDDPKILLARIARHELDVFALDPSLAEGEVSETEGLGLERLRERLAARVVPLPPRARHVEGGDLVERFALGPEPAGRDFAPTSGIMAPPAVLALAATTLGAADQELDRDGIVRHFEPVKAHDGQLYPSLPLALLLAAYPPDARPKVSFEGSWFRVGEHRIPLEGDTTFRLRYLARRGYVEEGRNAKAALQDALREADGLPLKYDWSFLEGAYILVMPKAVALLDHSPSPVNDYMAGGDINAVALDNLLNGVAVTVLPRWVEGAVALLLALVSVLLAATVTERVSVEATGTFGDVVRLILRGVGGALAAGIVVFPVVLADHYLFKHHDTYLNLSLVLATPLVATLFNAFTAELMERRDRRSIHEALGIYTSGLVADLVASGGVEALAPRRDDISVYFSDIAGFTSFSERMEPEHLAELLNAYLSEMTEVILQHEGIVDKYIGDAIMAFWGWRESQPDHPIRAVRAALALERRLAEIRPELEARFGVRLEVRAGINSGVAVAGNLGSRQKMAVTLMGDVVNLASRLEGANKAYGTRLLVGEATWSRLGGRFLCREIDLLRVKGKDRPVRVFEPLCEVDEAEEAVSAFVQQWEEALAAYRRRDFAAALECFERLSGTRVNDEVAQLYVSRCREYLAAPPPDTWDGVFVLRSK